MVEQVCDLQLARASEDDFTYAVFLDFASYKDIYFVTLTKSQPKQSVAPGYLVHRVSASLLGKVRIATPSLAGAYVRSKSLMKVKVNQQMRMLSQVKMPSRRIDGISLFVDQVRIDLDHAFFRNETTTEGERGSGRAQVQLTNMLPNATNIFEYSYSLS